MARRSGPKTGHWAFLIGIALAVIAGVVPQLQTPTVTWVMVLLGLVVGLLNITAKETQEFLIATIALVLVSSAASNIVALGVMMSSILMNIVTFVFPAALLVALKAIWELASN